MARAADLTEASWREFNGLLDAALELPREQRLAWIDTLGAEHDALKPTLRAVLARFDGVETGGWLDTLPHTGSAAAVADDGDLQSGGLVGPYRLLREIGVGGMGAVWLAERADGTLKRQVALKLPRATWSRGLAERMARERDILAALEHPNIARLYDAGTDTKGRPFLALEYVDGEPIDEYCRQHALTIKARLQLLLQVAHAVAFAHSRLVVHRDLKPSNILVTAEGQVRLLDFGIAKLMESDRAEETQLTQLAGRALTLDYASPEQIRGEPLGTASDVYSLGVVSYELLAGAKPYKLKRQTAAQLEEAIAAIDAPLASSLATDAAARRELKGDLDAILNKALKKDPAERYASVVALAEDIRHWLQGEPVAARPDSAGYKLRKFVGRHRVPVTAASIALLTLVALTATALVQRESARQEASRARAVQAFLIDLFESNAGPQDRAAGQRTTARELLDRGADRIDEALRDEPEARFEVLRTLADIYWRIDLQEQAATLERRRVELARQRFGANDPRLAKVLLDYAETIQESEQRDQIPALLEEAQRVLSASGEQTSEMHGQALAIAADYWRHVSLPRSLQAAEDGVNFLQRHFPSSDRRLVAHMHAARMRAFLGQFDAALAHTESALEIARGQGNHADIWSLQPSMTTADIHYARHALGEAETWLRRALDVATRVQGERHLTTLSAKARLGNVLQEVGRTEEAETLHATVRSELDNADNRIDRPLALHLRGQLGQRWLERGRPDFLLPILPPELEDLRHTLPRSALMAARLRQWAQALAALGKDAAAREALAESQATWTRFGEGMPAPVIDSLFALASADMELSAARAEAALVALSRHPATDTRSRINYPLRRARALLTLGQTEQAAAALQEGALEIAALPEAERPLPVRADLLLLDGRVQLALGDLATAEQRLRESLALRLRHDADNSLWVAEVRDALADVLAQRGQATAARDLRKAAAQARDAVHTNSAAAMRPTHVTTSSP